MKVVKAQNQKTINLTNVEPIRQGDSSKDSPAEQRQSVATRPASILSVGRISPWSLQNTHALD